MKRLILIALALVIAAALAGCGHQPQKRGSLEEIYGEMAKENLLPPMTTVDRDLALDFYGITPGDCVESLMKIAEDSLRADEVLLFRAADQISADRIARLLGERLSAKGEEAKGYSPEQYAVIQKGALIRNDLSVALIVSPFVDRLVEIYGRYAAF